MPIYEYRCLECGAVFSLFVPHVTAGQEQQFCSACGSQQTRRLVSSFAIGGRARPGPGRAAWPTSWGDTNGGDPETLRYWRRRIEQEARLEEKYPELRTSSLGDGSGQAETPAQVAEHSLDGQHHHEHHHHPHSEPRSLDQT